MSAPEQGKRSYTPLIIFGLIAALLVASILKMQKGELKVREVPSQFIDKPAPQFNLPSLLTDVDVTQDDLKCGVSLLNVWASWCYACRQEHEAITWLSQQGFRVVGLNYKDEPDDARQWLQQFGDPYTVIASDIDGRVGIDWGVYGAPETFVIDEQGIIRDKRIGPVDRTYIEDKLLPLAEEIRKTSTCTS